MWSLPRLFAVAAAAVVAALLAVAPAQAGVGNPRASGPHFEGSYSGLTITYGQGWRVWGSVVTGADVPVTDGVVNLGGKVYHHPWELLRTDDSAASFDFTVRPRKRTAYQLCYVGTGSPAADPACTTIMTVKVHRKLTLPAVHSKARTLTGRVRPGYRHRRVIVQRKRCAQCQWRRMRVVHTNARSVWRVHIPVRRMRYRAVTPASNGYLRSRSRAQFVVVRRADPRS